MAKVKDREFESQKEKKSHTTRETSKRQSADFLTEICPARKEWYDIFRVIKVGGNPQLRILY